MVKTIVEQLRPIFEPGSIAVIGASSISYKWGAQTMKRLLEAGYKGAIYPINPKERKIQGLSAYRNIMDVPNDIDLAFITIPAKSVPQAIKECVRKGVKGAIIISADFAETGGHGLELQEEVSAIAREGGLRFVGPNCMGLCNTAIDLNTFPATLARGSIGLISQSGSLSHMLGRVAVSRGYGMSKIISVGNQADLDVADFLAYMGDDPDTKAIAVYLEGVSDGRKLFNVAKGIAGKKPVVVYKAGKNPGSARVAMSHTAAISGEDRIFDVMCQQVGFIRSTNLFGTMDMAGILTSQPLPGGNRIGIEGTGGQCMVIADLCLSMGMEVPELRKEDSKFIISGIDFPPHAPPPVNPVDFGGSHTALMDANVLNKMAQLDYIDGIIALRPTTFRSADDPSVDREEVDTKAGEILAAIPQEFSKPVVLISGGSTTTQGFSISPTMKKIFDAAGIPCYSAPEEAVMAMYTLVKYTEITRRFAEGPAA